MNYKILNTDINRYARNKYGKDLVFESRHAAIHFMEIYQQPFSPIPDTYCINRISKFKIIQSDEEPNIFPRVK